VRLPRNVRVEGGDQALGFSRCSNTTALKFGTSTFCSLALKIR
jgi:hypothetical protein